MPILDIGKFTVTPGTPVRLTSTQADPALKFSCHAVIVQTLWDNTGKIYVGSSRLNKATRAGIHATLAVPTANSIPSFTAALVAAPNGLNLADFYVDGDNSGEGVTVSILVA